MILLPGGTGNDAVRERSAAIAGTCKTDKWSQAVLTCIGSSRAPRSVVDELTEAQSSSLDTVLGGFPDGDDEHAHSDGDVPHVDCEVLPVWVGRYPPVRGPKDPEAEWDAKVRADAILEACEHDGWDHKVRTCLASAGADDSKAIATCLEALDASDRDELTKKLTEIDALAGAIAKAKTKPATIGCKKVVAAHYGDAKWKTKLDGFAPADRKRMIAESRAKMQTACTSWDDTLRACIVAGGNETCFQSYAMGLAWGYPAAGVKVALGLPECDDYAATIAKVVACDKLPQASRDALQQSSEELFSQVIARPQKERASFASTCKAGADAIAQALTAAGC